MRVCPKCGQECEDGMFCDICGADLSGDADSKMESDVNQAVESDTDPKIVTDTKQNLEIEEPSIKKYIILGSILVTITVLAAALVFFSSSLRKTKQDEPQNPENEQQMAEEGDSVSNDTALTPEPTAEQTPEPTKEPVPQSTYRYVIKDCSWWQAHEECAAMGGHLVHFDTPGEFEKVIADFTSKGYADNSKFWIGGARNNSDIYYWIDSDGTLGEAISLDDSHWMEGEPSYSDPGLNNLTENRMILYYYQNEWVYNDEADNLLDYIPRYSGTVGYICEFEY